MSPVEFRSTRSTSMRCHTEPPCTSVAPTTIRPEALCSGPGDTSHACLVGQTCIPDQQATRLCKLCTNRPQRRRTRTAWLRAIQLQAGLSSMSRLSCQKARISRCFWPTQAISCRALGAGGREFESRRPDLYWSQIRDPEIRPVLREWPISAAVKTSLIPAAAETEANA
jgi:hypothetical protein